MKSIISILILISFPSISQEIYMPDLKRASTSKKTLEDYFRAPQSQANFDCPAEEYDIAWPFNYETGDLISKVLTGDLKFKPWCDGQEGSYQFGDAYFGGFISNSAEVEATVIIGPKASVCDNAKVKGTVKVCGQVEVRGDVVLEGKIEIYGKGKISPR